MSLTESREKLEAQIERISKLDPDDSRNIYVLGFAKGALEMLKLFEETLDELKILAK